MLYIHIYVYILSQKSTAEALYCAAGTLFRLRRLTQICTILSPYTYGIILYSIHTRVIK